tara:strand:+ start:44 stop:1720 length:1677 start_codon:yes stop_codon:yes gene_type:complete
MTSNQKFSLMNSIENQVLEDEFDIKQIFYALYRNKKLIAKFTFASILLSGVIAFSTKRVWQGEFQIVLETSSINSSGKINPVLSNFVGLSNKSDPLRTEVEILKSPSVLMNIFQYLKSEKSLKNKSIEDVRFKDWKNSSLDIQLEQGTSILNLSYRDNDKDLILPVLNKISNAYQEYSGKRRLREIKLGIDFFNEQIAMFKSKSIESLRKAQKFAINQDLSILSQSEIDLDIPNSINIEAIRVNAANRIRVINQQLKQIEELKDQSEQIMYVSSTIPAMSELTEKLKGIDNTLTRSRVLYKEKDKVIQDLLKERSLYIDLLKRQVIGFLTAEKANEESRLKAAERPEGVLIEYRMLLSDAAKDKAILDNLETQYRSLLLEKARSEDPWELITTPTLLPHPVAPRRKRMLALGLLSGIIIGSVTSLIIEKRKGIIFSINEMESIVKFPLISEMSFRKNNAWKESIDLLVSGPLSGIDGSIALITVGEIDKSYLSELEQSLKVLLKNRDVEITNDVRKAVDYSNLIVVAGLGITRRQEITNTTKKLLLQKNPVLGLIILT